MCLRLRDIVLDSSLLLCNLLSNVFNIIYFKEWPEGMVCEMAELYYIYIYYNTHRRNSVLVTILGGALKNQSESDYQTTGIVNQLSRRRNLSKNIVNVRI